MSLGADVPMLSLCGLPLSETIDIIHCEDFDYVVCGETWSVDISENNSSSGYTIRENAMKNVE